MTDRKQALRDLRVMVSAGVKYETMGHTIMCQQAFPKPNDFDGSRKAYADSSAQKAILVWRNGSLDAAKALHNAVLPGCSQYSIVTDPTCLKVSVCWWPNGLSGKTERHGEGWGHPDQEARAWLLAILSALIGQQSDTAKEAT